MRSTCERNNKLAWCLFAIVSSGVSVFAADPRGEGRPATALSKSARETLAMNEKTELGFVRQSRLLLREVRVENGSPNLQNAFVGLLRTALLEAGVAFVSTPEEVQRETRDRQEERANEEVQQSLLPEKQTIIRETTEVKAVVTLTHTAKDTEALTALLSLKFPIVGGFGYEKKQTAALLTLEVWDNETQTSRSQLNALGRETDTTHVIVGGYPIAYRQARSDQERRDMKAMGVALENLKMVIRQKLTEENKPLAGHVLSLEKGYVLIDIGSNNGVTKGMVFEVLPVVKTGSNTTPLPPVAKVKVVSLDGNSCAAQVLDGKIEEIEKGYRVSEVREH